MKLYHNANRRISKKSNGDTVDYQQRIGFKKNENPLQGSFHY